MKLLLLHGRTAPDQNLDDWGVASEPIHGVEWMHITYLSLMTIGFINDEFLRAAQNMTGWEACDARMLEVARHDDLIFAGGYFYGDFDLVA